MAKRPTKAKAKTKAKAAEPEDVSAIEEDDEGNLVVDLSGVDEDGGFEVAPRGIYPVYVSGLVFGPSKASGNPMWSWEFTVEDGHEYKNRKFFSHTVFTDKAMPMAKKTIMRVAPELLEKKFSPEEVANEGTLLGKRCRVKVDIQPYEGKPSNTVKDILGPNEEGDTEGDGGGFL